jgi:16S rRNA (guanine527-N7)-methyltransferase
VNAGEAVSKPSYQKLSKGILMGVDPEAEARRAGTLLFGERFPLAEQYAEILATKGLEWGLLGPREADKLWCRHLVNSLTVESLVPPNATVLDVGSGAGLPGIPLAIARPDLRVTLLDSLLRRTEFLSETVTELGVSDQVSVVRSRAEDYSGRFDAVVSRAVAPLTKLIDWTMHLVAPDGALLALKGETAGTEVAESSSVLRDHGLTAELIVPEGCQSTVIRVVRD